jgi:hypothetical protein
VPTDNFDFEDLLSDAQHLEQDAAELADGKGKLTNEFGEFVDEEELGTDQEDDYIERNFVDTSYAEVADAVNEEPEQSNNISESHSLSNQPNPNRNATWLKNSVLAPTETDKEYELFTCYVRLGGGRSLQYVSEITNFGIEKLKKIVARNNWVQRVADYDRYQLSKKMAEVEGERHKLHLRKLESYREQQEQIGQQLSLSAARIAYLANRKLTAMLDSDQNLDVRDMPSMLNAASKLAEVGKNLQGNALGVDQLLAAIEEAEID